MSGEATLRIGQVQSILREEFPDLSISKLRFLEDQGLVTPTRTSGGYRKYTDDDVERLRQILRLQRDEFLPLRVIREHLRRSMTRPAAQGAPGVAAPARRAGVQPALDSARRADDGEFDLGDIAERADVPLDFVRECQEYGLVGQAPLGPADVAVVTATRTLARYGVGVRHLRQIAAAARAQAELVGRYAAARARRGENGGDAENHAAALAEDLFGLVREIFIRESARSLAGASASPRTALTGASTPRNRK